MPLPNSGPACHTIPWSLSRHQCCILPEVQHTDKLKITLRAIMSLYQAGAAISDIASKFDAIVPSSSIAPPMIEFAIRGTHYHFEIARCVVVTLDKTWYASGIRRTEYPSIMPGASRLLVPPMVKAPVRRQVH